MGVKQQIGKLKDYLGSAPHINVAGTETFLELDVPRVKARLRLIERGRERGLQALPPSDSTDFDGIENEIVTQIEAEKKRSADITRDNLHTYSQRLHSLGLPADRAAVPPRGYAGNRQHC